MELRELLGGKGANLAEMKSVLKLPVPPGFTVSTDACHAYLDTGWPSEVDSEIAAEITKLETETGRVIGDPNDPLLVSVRSGAAASMPGMMDTVLNLGLNDKSVKGLAKITGNERFAYDSYRRFISIYARIVMDADGGPFDELYESARHATDGGTDNDIPAAALKTLCADYKKLVKASTGKPFPQDPMKQLRGAIEAVFDSWNRPRAIAYRVREHIPHSLGTAVTVQAMVFGNRDDQSGTGVGFTRNASTGENAPFGDFLVNAQGEDVVSGNHTTQDLAEMKHVFPEVYEELMAIFLRLEHHYRDMCDTEFTIEQGKLWMLQTRVGKRTGAAAMKMAIDMTKGTGSGKNRWKISRDEALLRIDAEHLDAVLHPQFEGTGAVIATGVGASPGAAVGAVYFTADGAADASDRGEPVILVRNETSPEDVHGMMEAEGILTARGGLVSHAAVVARGWGTPAIVGAEAIKITDKQFTVGSVTVREGDIISIDGSTGEVVLGEMATAEAELPAEFSTILQWADKVRKGKLGVRANADSGEDAAKARELGAEGIGLCRTEHMFLAADRLPVVRRMILANTVEEEAAALDELRSVQQSDFEEVLDAMDGLPVTIRLLDPPLHEFLPSLEELKIKQATTGLSEQEERELEAAETWSEHNPMIGTRGVRLGVIKPGLYAMQVRALLDAAAALRKQKKNPIVEIMIPLTVTREELALARSWVQDEIDLALKGMKNKPDITIGTMVETPRAAVRADEIAEAADFFSFGTNDLTQLTFGFSRDDVESRMMPAYLEQGLLKRNPFDTIDQTGVGDLVRLGVERGRSTKKKLKIGVCGEHGGDPVSIDLFYRLGLDYVSCSPYRVPIARLSAAQAVLNNK